MGPFAPPRTKDGGLGAVTNLLEKGGALLSTLGVGGQGRDSGASSAVRRLPAAGSAPGPRESHSLTTVGARVFAFGGFDGGRVLNDLYVFDTHTGLWSQLIHTGISPPARAGHSATALGVPAHLLVFGGANSSRRFNDAQVFDTTDNHWSRPPVRGRPPSARYYHCACMARGSLLVLGGNDGSSCLADLHALNTESWSWSQPLTNGSSPPPRCGHSGTLVNKLLFIVGGVSDPPHDGFTGAVELSDLHVLDTESWTWWRPNLASPLPPIAYHAATLTGDKIFIFGGSVHDALYNDLLMLDTSTCAWQVRSWRPTPERVARRAPCPASHTSHAWLGLTPPR